ncbi:MAG: hypothetical protein SGPRY_012761 [Prymnesium sp.]
MDSLRSSKLTLAEQFSRTFDATPFQAIKVPANLPTRPAQPEGMTPGSTYGFGSACLRFQNDIYPSHLNYGKSNKSVIELDSPQPVAVDKLHANAPSRMLPEFAAFYSPEIGCGFSKGPNRDAPPDSDGTDRYWVQPKDSSGIFPSVDPPEIFSMPAPRGTGKPTLRHEAPQYLMTPAERREALVFEKSNDRARRELRKAANDACQLTLTMQNRYPMGVIGLEGPNCPDSIIYRIPHDRKHALETAKAEHAAARHENLRLRRDTQLPYNFLHHDPSNGESERLFSRKGKTVLSAASRELRHYEMRPVREQSGGGFRSNQEMPLGRSISPSRRGQLLDASTGGHPYNIISGVTSTFKPTRVESPDAINRRAHPSNIAMPKQYGTSSTLVGPTPDAHQSFWKASSQAPRVESNSYLR